jgi:Tn3 transposase DDE domain
VFEPFIAGRIDENLITAHWDDVLRLATSVRTGAASASLLLKRLGAYLRQNGLALALREIGQIERTLFMLDWFELPALRRQVTVELNKGEARNALSAFIASVGCAIVQPKRNSIVRAGSRPSPPLSPSGTPCISAVPSTTSAAAGKLSRTRCLLTLPPSGGSTSISPAIIYGTPTPNSLRMDSGSCALPLRSRLMPHDVLGVSA